MIKARAFVIIVTLFIFLPVGYLLLREGMYRAKHGNTPIPAANTPADTAKKDTITR